MRKITVRTENEKQAIKECKKKFKWTPETTREVDSGEEGVKAFACFEDNNDAILWDNQE